MKHNVYLFQPQYSVEVRNEKNYWIPYSAGCLWSYVQQYEYITDNFCLAEIVFRREPQEDIIARLADPKICGFSCYIWNYEYCIALAEKIKLKWPQCLIVFGGAQTNKNFLKYDFVDAVVEHEGEEAFLQILTKYLDTNIVTSSKQFYDRTRVISLDFPSPYNTGVFDQIVKDNPSVVWAATLETNRGCPYRCSFCDLGDINYNKIKKFGLERVAQDLDWMSQNRVVYIMISDNNFGIFQERDIEISNLILAASRKPDSLIDTLHLNYAKNSSHIVFEIGKILRPIMREGITISMQSMNPETLKLIQRDNLEINKIDQLMLLSERYKIPTYTEMIIGLPNETLDTWTQGCCQLLELGQHSNLDIFFAGLLPNAELASDESRRKYKIQSVVAEDYLTYRMSKEDFGYPEKSEIVTGTSTMTTKDLVEGYMYSWMLIHFHIAGFTQFIARHLNAEYSISYYEYYNQLQQTMSNYDSIYDHYCVLKDALYTYLLTGKMEGLEYPGHTVHTWSYNFFYQNKNTVTEIGIATAQALGIDLHSDANKLQQLFLYDANTEYPVTVESSIDPNTFFLQKPQRYKVDSQIKQREFNYNFMRRRGYTKNTFVRDEYASVGNCGQTLNIVTVCTIENDNYKRPVYDKQWVDKLYKALVRNLHIPFNFYCFSNDISSDEYTVLPLKNKTWGWWNKLEVFNHVFDGPCMYLDLDIVICGDITDAVSQLPIDSFLMTKEPYKDLYNSSIMLWNGDYKYLYNDYNQNKSDIETQYQMPTTKQPAIGDGAYIKDKLENNVQLLDRYLPMDFINWKHHKVITAITNPKMLIFTATEKPHNSDLQLVKNNWVD